MIILIDHIFRNSNEINTLFNEDITFCQPHRKVDIEKLKTQGHNVDLEKYIWKSQKVRVTSEISELYLYGLKENKSPTFSSYNQTLLSKQPKGKTI